MASLKDQTLAYRIVNMDVGTFYDLKETLEKYKRLGTKEVTGLSLEGGSICFKNRRESVRYSLTNAAKRRVMATHPSRMSISRLAQITDEISAII